MISSRAKYTLTATSIFLTPVCHFILSQYQTFLIPALSLVALVFLTLPVRPRKRLTQRIVPVVRDAEPATPIEIQKQVHHQIDTIPVAALGIDFRKQSWRTIETQVDGIIDNTLLLIKSRLVTHTIAVFFPTTDGGYKMRRQLSNSTNLNPDALLYPGLGILGGFLKDGSGKLSLQDIVNDSSTLFYYKQDDGVHSLIASSISIEGSTRGIIVADSTEKNHFSDEDHAYLSTFAALLGQAVYSTYLYNEHKLEHLRLAAMSGIEKDFFSNLSLDAIFDKIVEIIPFALPCDRVTVSLKIEEKAEAQIKRAWGLDVQRYLGMVYSIKEKSLSSLLFNKNMMLSRNFSQEHDEYRFTADETRDTVQGSFCAVPLGVDECKGMILIESLKRDSFDSSTRELLTRIGTSAGLAIEKILIIDKAKALATHDGLTGLNNHREFQQILKDEITRSIRYNDPLALVLCDIDFFKKVNDTWGHQFGDTVLKGVASKLENSIRQGVDNAARYGGEEFTLILVKTDQEQAVETVERIRKQIHSIVFHAPGGQEVNISMSFGIAMYRIHAKQIDELIKKADKALYRAKEQGRNRVEVF
ncbi:MAG TPA: diguanylate cyclase [Chitinispirillaceae bacterium]|nr:diguanylate cyclase [Chitinispirillaceae bacterium]